MGFELTTLVMQIYSQRIIHSYYLSTMSTVFLPDLFYFILCLNLITHTY